MSKSLISSHLETPENPDITSRLVSPSRFNSVSLQNLVDGFLLDCSARRLSPHTILDYTNSCKKLLVHFGGKTPAEEITKFDIRKYFTTLNVSNKTLRNISNTVSLVFKFGISERVIELNPTDGIKLPKPEIRTINPIPPDEIHKLIKAVDTTDPENRSRNKVLVLLLLDTGCRVSELCGIKIADIDIDTRTIKVFGKNAKERNVYYSTTTAKSLWKYLATFRDETNKAGWLFTNLSGKQLSRDGVTAILRKLCNTAGIPVYSPHKFRHTFAITYLRSGGNIFTLQRTLGHATLEMSKKYLLISDVDTKKAHELASPVLNLGL